MDQNEIDMMAAKIVGQAYGLNNAPLPQWNNPKSQAAIALKVPRSGIPELDDMIRESRRLDMATAAMQGMLSCPIQPQSGADMYARDAYEIAEAMLAASGKEQMKCC